MSTEQERALTPVEQTELWELIERGYDLLTMPKEAAAEALVFAISRVVDHWQQQRDRYRSQSWQLRQSGPGTDETASPLGAVWADKVVREAGWEWIYFRNYFFALVSPGREYVVYPTYIYQGTIDPHIVGMARQYRGAAVSTH
jgi:hypothetical protein